MIKYRIAEFEEAISENGHRFFVQIGKKVWKKLFWFIYYPVTVWEELKNDKQIIGHAQINDAYKLIEELKKQEPKYHYIK